MKRLLLLPILFISLLLVNCGDDDGPVISEVIGIVIDGGELLGFEQCGFLIEIEGALYVPNVLNSQFRQHELPVFLNVEFLEAQSDCAATPIGRLRIEQIRLR